MIRLDTFDWQRYEFYKSLHSTNTWELSESVWVKNSKPVPTPGLEFQDKL